MEPLCDPPHNGRTPIKARATMYRSAVHDSESFLKLVASTRLESFTRRRVLRTTRPIGAVPAKHHLVRQLTRFHCDAGIKPSMGGYP